MEGCTLPIEVCERILEMIPSSPGTALNLWENPQAVVPQRTLAACALTCRAWRSRAQFVLWTTPIFLTNSPVLTFTAILRRVSPSFARCVSVLDLNFEDTKHFALSHAGDFFLLSLPNLQVLQLFSVDLRELPTRILRMRPPLCANITRLALVVCILDTPRAMLDLIWSCPELCELKIGSCLFRREAPLGAPARLVQVCTQLNTCRKLTKVSLSEPSDSLVLRMPARVFGTSVTALSMFYYDLEHAGAHLAIPRFLDKSFSHLRDLEITIQGGSPEVPPPPHAESFLCRLVQSLSAPGSLRQLKIAAEHDTTGSTACCQWLFGRSDMEDRLRSVPLALSNLAILEIVFHYHVRSQSAANYPEICASYVASVLPSMPGALVLLDDDGRRIQVAQAQVPSTFEVSPDSVAD